MKAVIEIPEELYRQVKARTEVKGRRIGEVTVELFRNWLDEEREFTSPADVPRVTPSQLNRQRDGDSLRRAYPKGYRLDGPLVPAVKDSPAIRAATVEQAIEAMNQEELATHDRAC